MTYDLFVLALDLPAVLGRLVHLLQHALQVPHLPAQVPHLALRRHALGLHLVQRALQLLALVRHVVQLHHLLLQVAVLDRQLGVLLDDLLPP